jgi:hypothetical protein
MSKARKKGYRVPVEGGQFVPILTDELDSPAYQNLSGNSAKLYTYLKKAARTVAYTEQVSERDAIFDYTYSEARKHGFCERTFARCVKELWTLGFLTVIERGGLRGARRSNSKYRLCKFWKTYGVKDGWLNRAAHESNPFDNPCEPEKGGEGNRKKKG